jgi:Domain of unknown function (DUF4868)
MAAMATEPDPRTTLVDAASQADATAHLILAWRSSGAAYRLRLVETDENVSGTFRDYARRTASQLAQRAEVTYDPDWPLAEHEYFALHEEDLPAPSLFRDLADFQNLLGFERRHLTKPKMYVVAVQMSSGTAWFGRRMAFLQVLKQKKGLFAAVWDGSTFNALTHSVATFAETFDWVLWDGSLYILDSLAFHAEFRDTAAVLRAVTAHVAEIQGHVAIRNSDEFVARCRANVQMASKLRRVAENGLHLTSSIEQLKAYASQYRIRVEWEEDDLVFDGSLEGQWAILKLLDEDRTEGPVSHRHYESSAKREI